MSTVNRGSRPCPICVNSRRPEYRVSPSQNLPGDKTSPWHARCITEFARGVVRIGSLLQSCGQLLTGRLNGFQRLVRLAPDDLSSDAGRCCDFREVLRGPAV